MLQNAIFPRFVMRPYFVVVLWPAKPSRPGRQVQARKTVLKQKSRSSTTKFWMYYNFSYVPVNFEDMFTPTKKDMYRNVIFPRFTFATKIVLLYIIMASEVLLHFHA